MKKFAVQAVVGVCVAAAAVAFWISRAAPRPANPDEAVSVSLDESASVDDRERAIFALAKMDRAIAKERLRRVLAEAKSVEVRAAAISAIGEVGDLESVPRLIDALSDHSTTIRHRAHLAIAQILGRSFGFDADGPIESRNHAIATIRQDYEKMRRNPHPKYQ